jgi:D-glycerate 3-kinase
MQKLNHLIKEYIIQERLPDAYLDVALKWFTPLCESINAHQNKASTSTSRPYFVGVNGCQGSGKSTLSGLLRYLLTKHYTKKTIVVSLDDFYLTKAERNLLAKNQHPLLATRGVPGTHDTDLMAQVFKSLAAGTAVNIPTFDKSIDDRSPFDQWQQIEEPIDIVIMEGWCWGTQAEDAEALSAPINDFEAKHDASGTWRQFVNNALAKHYVPLYAYIDNWVFLKAPSFNAVYAWRLQQEQKLRARIGTGKELMSDAEILSFIQYYQRLTTHTLCTLDKDANWVFELDNERNIIKSRQYA